MFREIQVGEKTVPMLSNAATPIYYRQVFSKDLLVFLQSMNNKGIVDGFSETVSQLGYVMAAQADKKKINELNFDKYIEWLSDFEPLDFEQASGDILGLYTSGGRTLSRSKKE